MHDKNSPQSVIDSYKRKQKMLPFLVGTAAVLLLVVGIIILVVWLSEPGRVIGKVLATDTPTPTATFTPTPTTPTATPTATSTETETPTITLTATPSGPIEYKVVEGDTCYDIRIKFNVQLEALLALNPTLGTACNLQPGDILYIPQPDMVLELPTETPIPTGLPRGTRIQYTVKTGDTLAGIASRFNSTIQAIMAIQANGITDAENIQAGQVIIVPINLVTPTPTRTITSTRQIPTLVTVTPRP
jgi:LysM repeat protein